MKIGQVLGPRPRTAASPSYYGPGAVGSAHQDVTPV